MEASQVVSTYLGRDSSSKPVQAFTVYKSLFFPFNVFVSFSVWNPSFLLPFMCNIVLIHDRRCGDCVLLKQ